MKHVTTLADYCKQINVHLPRHEEFDARTFDENMPTVKRHVNPFKHEFYAIGLLFSGTSYIWHGTPQMKANVIFNTPYQLISWDIENDWSGYYVIFTQDFLVRCHFAGNLLIDFPFFKLDNISPITVPEEQFNSLKDVFEKIIDEYNNDRAEKFRLIESYLSIMLLHIKRFCSSTQPGFFASEQNRNADLNLVSRYQSLIESKINDQDVRPEFFSTSFYAEQLAIHPNHLNAIVKRITGNTAKHIIQDKIILPAKSLLTQSDLSIKEIAFRLGYEEPTHFGSFFKKHTQLTPNQFKELSRL
jgi:AraC family transcriptional activator of pobA